MFCLFSITIWCLVVLERRDNVFIRFCQIIQNKFRLMLNLSWRLLNKVFLKLYLFWSSSILISSWLFIFRLSNADVIKFSIHSLDLCLFFISCSVTIFIVLPIAVHRIVMYLLRVRHCKWSPSILIISSKLERMFQEWWFYLM